MWPRLFLRDDRAIELFGFVLTWLKKRGPPGPLVTNPLPSRRVRPKYGKRKATRVASYENKDTRELSIFSAIATGFTEQLKDEREPRHPGCSRRPPRRSPRRQREVPRLAATSRPAQEHKFLPW